MTLKLGRKAIKTDSRTLKLARYMTALPAPPASCDWTKGTTEWGMMLNDTLGDCTIAGCGHAIQVCGLNVGYTFAGETLADSVIESAYSSWDGYVPGDPSTDNGGIELDVLTDWKKSNLGGHHLLGFADPAAGNLTEVKQAITLFGGVYVGFNVPQSVMDSANDPTVVWDVNGDNTIIGGHAVFAVGYDTDTVSVISWGQVYRMTWAFWNQFVDEAHALLLATWIRNNKTPSGFDLAGMQADLAAIV
jgi:hypothetical protein